MIERRLYMDRIVPFVDKEQVKVITGIRRCGKSTLLKLIANHLKTKGVSPHQILYINLESFTHSNLESSKDLYEYVKQRSASPDKQYLFIDEIQELEGWEKGIRSLLVDFDIDIYLTGSNAHLLSSDLSTFLAGRYIEIPVYTLSYSEYLDFRTAYFPYEKIDLKKSFDGYLRSGGFPVLQTTSYSLEDSYKVVYDIYSSVLLRDTVQRHRIRDLELLERIVKYAFDNIGNTFSGKKVADYFKSQQRKLDINTVYNYLHALESAFILYRVPRYDIQEKEILKTQEKFYLGDVGLLYATMGFRNQKISGILENLVYLELKRRDYQVFVGKLGQHEIDFIAEKKGEKIYIQVAYKLEREETIEREFSRLLAIKDQFPKFVVSMDEFWEENMEGIVHFHIADFLRMDSF